MRGRIACEYAACRRSAERDELTDAYRRCALNRAVELMGDGPLTCAFCDLNGLKAVNDAHGHAEGDRLIREAADALRYAGGKKGRLYRIGGDEFLLLLPYTGPNQQGELEGRIAGAVSARAGASGVALSLAVGVASLPDGGAVDWPILFREAERRMYRDKQMHTAEERDTWD